MTLRWVDENLSYVIFANSENNASHKIRDTALNSCNIYFLLKEDLIKVRNQSIALFKRYLSSKRCTHFCSSEYHGEME